MRRLLSDTRPGAARALRVLAGAGRAGTLVAMAVFTACVAALLLPAFRIDAVPAAARVPLAAIAVLSLFRPGSGLIAVAALVAVADVVFPLLGSRVRSAEALVLAALLGALLRGWWSGAIRRFPSSRLEIGALVFGLLIAASYLEQLWFLQIQRDFPGPFLAGLWDYASSDYLVGPATYGGALSSAMLLLEGLALLVWGARTSSGGPLAGRLMNAVTIGGIAAAALTLLHILSEFSESETPAILFPLYMWSNRWAVHVQDVNAAASAFGLTFFLAAGRAYAAGPWRRFWTAGAVLTGIALLLTHSRTTILVVLLTATGALAWTMLTTRSWRRAAPAAVVVGVLLVGVFLSQGILRGAADVGMDVRVGFLGTTARMLAWQPMSGVGVGQFSLWSQHFSSPELLRIYRVENAHNNFAQIAGELGLTGLAALLAVLAIALARWRRAAWAAPIARADVLALVAFLATWLGNHPMLLPAVAFPFWIALGAAPEPPAQPASAVAPEPFPPLLAERRTFVLVLALMALLAVTLPVRLALKSGAINWPRISYGFHEWEGEGDRRTRWMSRRARFYLAPEVSRFQLPVRALVTDEDPIALELLIDGKPASRVEMDNWDVRVLEMVLPGDPEGDAWQIDLVASRSWIPAEVTPDSQDTRELSVMVWPIVLFDRANAKISEEPEAPVVQQPPRRRRGWRRSEEPPPPAPRRENRDRPTRSRD